MKEITAIFVICYVIPFVNGRFFLGFHEDVHQKTTVCSELSTFTPNMCRHPVVLEFCLKECHSTNKTPLHCGKRIKRSSGRVIERRIVGGTKSLPGDWPWHVSLRLNGTQWCSGTILSEHFILTAAHCFDDVYTSTKAEDWQIYAGDHYLLSADIREQQIGVKKIIIHPNFGFDFHDPVGSGKSGGWYVGHSDIAILQLKNAIKLKHPDKTHACLPDDDKKIPDLYSCDIVGWGHTTFNGKQPEELREAKVFTIPNAICNLPTAYNNTINPDELICAGFERGGIDACNYDSGGSMVCEKQGTWYATGIVSSGFECARPQSYGLYTNIRNYKNWIIKAILTESVKLD